MNYFVEVKAFYDRVMMHRLSTGQIALWHALMHLNNKCGWIEWFSVPNATLSLLTGMGRSGLLKARRVLKEHGLIDYRTNGAKATAYRLCPSALFAADGGRDGARESGPPSGGSDARDGMRDGAPLIRPDGTTSGQDGQSICAREKPEKSGGFIPPDAAAVAAYCAERQNGVDPQQFVDYYAARGWMAGRAPMRDWRAAIRTWEVRAKKCLGEKTSGVAQKAADMGQYAETVTRYLAGKRKGRKAE